MTVGAERIKDACMKEKDLKSIFAFRNFQLSFSWLFSGYPKLGKLRNRDFGGHVCWIQTNFWDSLNRNFHHYWSLKKFGIVSKNILFKLNYQFKAYLLAFCLEEGKTLLFRMIIIENWTIVFWKIYGIPNLDPSIDI